MTIFKLLLKYMSWLAFAVGLVWSGKLSFADPKETPEQVIAPTILALSETPDHDLTILTPGTILARLAIGDLSDSALAHGDSLLEEFIGDFGPTTSLKIDISPPDEQENGPSSWTIPVAELAFMPNGTLLKEDNDFLFVAKREIRFDENGTHHLAARFVKNANGKLQSQVFEELAFYLLLGNLKEDVHNFTRLDVRPGIVLLAGIFGVFIHLFLLIIHAIVPWHDALPNLEPEI